MVYGGIDGGSINQHLFYCLLVQNALIKKIYVLQIEKYGNHVICCWESSLEP